MNKGFNPSPKKTPSIKNVTMLLQRKTRELKRIMKHPLVVAAQLDPAVLEQHRYSEQIVLDSSEVEVVE